jgi:hypothetical protein
MHVRLATTAAHRSARAIGLAALASLALGAAGCGGGSGSPPVASIAGTSPATTATTGASQGGAPSGGPGSGGESSMQVGSGGTAFSACMRAHGVPNFPDPDSHGVLTFGSSTGIDPGSPKFRSAQQACLKSLPKHAPPSHAQVVKMQAQALRYSACMRAHGVPKFPDPTFSAGGVNLRVDSRSVDPNSPQFQSAQKACQGRLPGAKLAVGGGPGSGTLQTGGP